MSRKGTLTELPCGKRSVLVLSFCGILQSTAADCVDLRW